MVKTTHRGYDAFANRREQDDLDRWRTSADIFQTVQSTPSEWSARIGIFARWGEGKSTVLGFLGHMLEEEGSIVFWFNPWASETFDDLLADFGRKLLRALDEKNLLVESPVKAWLRRAGDSVSGTGISELTEGGLELFKGGKLYSASVGMIGEWLRPDGEQLAKIREKLNGKRIVVLLDDLDRCAPELLPKLLLSLRELLDLPGFTFVLAFDDEIVAQALVGLNPAWGKGTNFLDKILDFQFHLLPISQANKVKLLHRSLAHYCPFVPTESTKEIEDLLPDNPRKLKALVRSFAAIKPQIDRHLAAELSWPDIWIAQLIRQESYVFFEKLLECKTLEEEAGVVFSVIQDIRRREHPEKANDKNDSINALMVSVGITDTNAQANLIRLVEASRARTGMHFRYFCELTLRSPLMTWKEFEDLFAKWVEARSAETITKWIEAHVAMQHESLEAIEAEFFQTLVNARESAISQAIAEDTTEELDKRYERVRLLLTMMTQYLSVTHRVTAERLKVLLDKTSQWIAFRKNDSEKRQREEEETVLLTQLDSVNREEAIALLELMKPWNNWETFGSGPEELPLRDGLRKSATDRLLPKIYEALTEFLGEEHSVKQLSEPGRYMAFKYVLYGRNMLPWKEDLNTRISEMLEAAPTRVSDYENAKELLRLTLEAAVMRRNDIDVEGVRKLLLDHVFVRDLWAAVTSRSIQWRMQLNLLTTRKQLLDYGVPDYDLPLTEELLGRMPEFEANQLNQ